MEAVFLKILNMSAAASWLILAVVALRALLKKAPKWVLCVLWALVAVRLMSPASLSSAFSVFNLTDRSAESGTVEFFRYNGKREKPMLEFDTVRLSPAAGAGDADDAGRVSPPVLERDTSNVYLPPALKLWLFVASAMLLYAAVSYLRLRGKVRASISVRDNVWICDEIKTPFILGIIWPRIYLPSGMDGARQAYVIAHESAHLKRRDHWWKPLGFLLLAVYWFNPLIWLAYILLCRDIELACDEKVISTMEKGDMIAYSEALLACSVPRRQISACPLAFGEVGVKERIKSVLNYKKPAFWVVVTAVIACIAVAVCFLTNPKAADAYEIAGKNWRMSVVLDDGGSVIACDEAQSTAYPQAEVISLFCMARDGAVLISGEQGTWEGSYTRQPSKKDFSLYNVRFACDGESGGTASVSDTKYNDGSAVKTLVLSCGGYTVYFYEEEAGAQKAEQWFDSLHGDEMDWDGEKEISVDQYPGVTFRWQAEKVGAVTEKETVQLYFGMPVWSVFFCDLTGDGKPELCSTVSIGSGIVDNRIIVYDYAQQASCELSARMEYDYSLRLHNGGLYVEKRACMSSDILETGTLAYRNGSLEFIPDWASISTTGGASSAQTWYSGVTDGAVFK